jgi:hypothetical protein
MGTRFLKVVGFAVLALVFTAWSRESLKTADLQGTWQSECVNDANGHYRTNVIFSGNSFQLYDSIYTQINCTGTVSSETPVTGTYSLAGNLMDWITGSERSYDLIEISSDKKTLHFGAKAGTTPSTRPTDTTKSRPYHKLN